jgi:hypothetical protein
MILTFTSSDSTFPSLTLEIDPNMTFSELSHYIAKHWGFPSTPFSLSHNSRLLSPSSTPSGISLRPNATLTATPLDDAVRPSLPLDDPTLPSYIVEPIERTPFPPGSLEVLTEMGCPLRQSRNALRVALLSQTDFSTVVDSALEHLAWFVSEGDNLVVEQYRIANSGIEEQPAKERYEGWIQRRYEIQNILNNELFKTPTINPWKNKRSQEGGEVPNPKELCEFLNGELLARRDLVLRVREKFPNRSIQDVGEDRKSTRLNSSHS